MIRTWFLTGVVLLILTSAVYAQDDADIDIVQTAAAAADEARAVATQVAVEFEAVQNTLATAEAAFAQAEDRLSEAQDTLSTAEERSGTAMDIAFNALGLFEAISFLVTVVAGAAAFFGVTRFVQAQNDLNQTRNEVLNEFTAFRDEIDASVKSREEELNDLRNQVQQTAEVERQNTSNALLANALIPLGERQYKTADYTGALNTYNRALELDPNNPVVNQRLAYVYTQSGDLENARIHYERAIEREPNFAPALAGLGFVTRRFGEQMSRKEEDTSLSEDARFHARIEREKLFNRAADLLLEALSISPRLVDDDGESWWGVLGGLYRRRGQIDQAIEAYRQATIVTPQSSYGFGNLALLYRQRNEREKMLQTYERVEQIAVREAEADQGNFWGFSDLIVSSYALGKSEQADRALPTAISIAPIDSPYMLEGLTDTLRDLVRVLQPEKIPPIENAVAILDAEIQRRAEQRSVQNGADDVEDDETSEDEG